jgi:pimeloyl-ACP methyl ester carboxylesterase
MTHITAIKDYKPRHPNGKTILLLSPHSGKIWQARRLISVLQKAGYFIRAMDFSTEPLASGNPQLLPDLINEVHAQAVKLRQQAGNEITLIGFSLGGLVSLNILRRDKQFYRAVLITGGDIAKAVHRQDTKHNWHHPYDELAELWKDVNLYSDPADLKHTSLVMLISSKDELVLPEDVRAEAAKQTKAGVSYRLLESHTRGHTGTIVEEMILHPKRMLRYIDMLDAKK